MSKIYGKANVECPDDGGFYRAICIDLETHEVIMDCFEEENYRKSYGYWKPEGENIRVTLTKLGEGDTTKETFISGHPDIKKQYKEHLAEKILLGDKE